MDNQVFLFFLMLISDLLLGKFSELLYGQITETQFPTHLAKTKISIQIHGSSNRTSQIPELEKAGWNSQILQAHSTLEDQQNLSLQVFVKSFYLTLNVFLS